MRLGLLPDSLLERLALRGNLVPSPAVDTLTGLLLVRSVMAATRLGVFEALAERARSADEVAAETGCDRRAVEKLLGGLVASGYLRHRAGRYGLRPMSRRWLLSKSSLSVRDFVLFRYVDWRILEHYERFLENGEPIDLHGGDWMTSDDWAVYQRGMRNLAGIAAPEVALRLPVPRRARNLLDLGGSHGYYSVVLCRRRRRLRATVLDLPEAVEHSAPLLAREKMGARVVHREGNALTEELGEEAWDVVFASALVHHLTARQNQELAARVARALKPGGVFAVLEPVRPRPGALGQTAALMDFYFAVTSRSGAWTAEEIAGWQRGAGLAPARPLRLWTAPGVLVQTARKRRRGW